MFLVISSLFRYYTRDFIRLEKEALLWINYYWNQSEESWKTFKLLPKGSLQPPPAVLSIDKKDSLDSSKSLSAESVKQDRTLKNSCKYLKENSI